MLADRGREACAASSGRRLTRDGTPPRPCGRRLAALGIQMRAIDLALVVARTQIRPHIVAGVLGVGQADRVQVDERHMLLSRECPHGFDIGRLSRRLIVPSGL